MNGTAFLLYNYCTMKENKSQHAIIVVKKNLPSQKKFLLLKLLLFTIFCYIPCYITYCEVKKMNIKPCVWTHYFDGTPEKNIENIINCGFSAAELSTEDGQILLERGNIEKTGKSFKNFLNDKNFVMTQGHLKLHIDICADDNGKSLEELLKWIDLYHAIGIKNMVLHTGGLKIKNEEERKQKIIESLRFLTNHIQDSDCFICLENLVITMKTAKEILEIISLAESKNLAICLDTGHLNLNKGNCYNFIHEVGSLLHAVHITDNEGYRDQHLMPYSIGMKDCFETGIEKDVKRVDFDMVVKGLKETSYQGMFNLEIPGETDCPFPIKIEKLKYCKFVLDYLLENN